MATPTQAQIENAFVPAREITDAEKFAGREESIEDVFYALMAEGSNIAIVGNRGIGKTSLARQVSSIGTGDNSILDKVGVDYDSHFDFLTVYLACGTQVRSTDELLERLLTSASCLGNWIYDVPSAKKSWSVTLLSSVLIFLVWVLNSVVLNQLRLLLRQ